MSGDPFGAAAQVAQQLFGSGVLEGSGYSNTHSKGLNIDKTNTVVRGSTNNKGTNVDTTQTKGDVKTTGKTTQTATGTSNNTGTTTNNSTTVGTADKGALDQARGIVSQALTNMNDTSITDNLVNSVLNKASVAFGQGEGGAQRNAGVYNSSTQDLLSGFAQGQATSDAAEAVLNYKTGQQQIATNANQSIIDATKSSVTTGGATTTDTGITSNRTAGTNITNQASNTHGTNTDKTTDTNQSLQQTKGFNVQKQFGTGHVVQGSKSQQGGLLDSSLICTVLFNQGRINSELYMTTQLHFRNYYSDLQKNSYWKWAGKASVLVRDKPHSFKANWFAWLTINRAHQVCHIIRPRRFDFSLKGVIAMKIVVVIVTYVGITQIVIPSLWNKLVSSKLEGAN